ncbi:glycerol-3-phosphate dehydrogenase subunit GlpB [Halobacteriales archaeon Cl-PHB]
MPDADVVVVGGGLAGCTAALAAARQNSAATVRLVTAGESSLRKASGLVDVLGYGPEGEGPIADPFDAIPDLPGDHPYQLVGIDALRDGLALFDDVTGDQYVGDHDDRNALVPTFHGRVKPTARYPASVAAGLASKDEEMLLVGLESLTDFDANLVGQRLEAASVPFDYTSCQVAFPLDVDEQPPQLRMARALDDEELVDDVSVRDELWVDAEEHRFLEDRIGFPAVLGLEHAEAIRSEYESAFGKPVFEIPMGPPSVLGYRLETTLYDALEAEGVEIHQDHPVVDARTDGPHVEGMVASNDGDRQQFDAGSVVLATGGLVGGGVRADRTGVTEPVFDCPVTAPADRGAWSAPAPLGDHPFARFGLDVDPDTRPLGERGDICYENLYAAGGVVGSYDFAAEMSGSGVSLATGVRAGRRAAE